MDSGGCVGGVCEVVIDVVVGVVGGDGEGAAFDLDEVRGGDLEVVRVGGGVEGGAHEYEEEKTLRALEDFEIEDYSDMRKALQGIDAVLENYMEPDNYVNWAKAWKKTRTLYV